MCVCVCVCVCVKVRNTGETLKLTLVGVNEDDDDDNVENTALVSELTSKTKAIVEVVSLGNNCHDITTTTFLFS